MANVSTGKNNGVGVLIVFILFSLIFAGAFSGPSAIGIYRAKSWSEVPCRILSSKVEEAGRHDGSPTYRVAVTYQYQVDGKTYQGDRYHFFKGSSSGWASKEKVVKSLPKGTKTVCFVNPANPEESVLNRAPSWELLFLAAPLVPISILLFMLFGRRGNALSDLSTGEFRSSNRSAMFLAILFGVIFPGATTVIGFAASQELARGFGMLWVFLGIFGLASLFLMGRAIHAVLRYIKFGESTLKISSFPVYIGGILDGVILPGKAERLYGGDRNFTVRLVSVYRFITVSGNDRSRREEVMWEEKQDVQSADGTLRFSFVIPRNGRATTPQDASDIYAWRVEVASARPGVDYAATFDIPVIEGEIPEDQKQRFTAGGVPDAAQQGELEPSLPSERQVRVEEDRSGATVFVFPAMAHRLALLFMIVPTAFIAFWIYQMSWIFSGTNPFFHGVGVVFYLVALSSLGGVYTRLYRPSRVVVDSTGITIFTRRLGFPVSKRISGEEIEAVEVKRGGSNPSITASSVQIRCREGKEIAAGYYVKDRREAEWVAAEMRRLVGIEVKHEQKN